MLVLVHIINTHKTTNLQFPPEFSLYYFTKDLMTIKLEL